MHFPLLTVVTLTPLLGALFVATLPRSQPALVRGVTFAITVLTFLLSLGIWAQYDGARLGFQLVDSFSWIAPLGARLHLGVDGLSLLLVMLTTFLSPLIVLGAWRGIDRRAKDFHVAYLVLECAMIGTLLALDLLVFYVFWEFMLIPMYLIIGVWGGPRRVYATVKFILYTMAGSLLMLVGIIYLYVKAGATTFAYEDILELHLSAREQFWLFSAFALAFAIKVPVFPFHTWLPDAHTEAPTPGSVVLAGVLLKLGTYGLLRFAIPLFPEAATLFAPTVALLAVIGIVYGALMAYAQGDIKKLVAYSSVSHLGFVMLGIAVLSREALEGSILQMVNHGISTGALFLLVGMIYERRHTRRIVDYGGIAAVMPIFATIFLIVTMSSIGLPGTNGFVGEFLILAGTVQAGLRAPATLAGASPALVEGVAGALLLAVAGAFAALAWVCRREYERPFIRQGLGWLATALAVATVVAIPLGLGGWLSNRLAPLGTWRVFAVAMGVTAATGVILGAIYMLSMVRRVFFGPLRNPDNRGLRDLTLREVVVMVPLLAAIFGIGFFPGFLLRPIHKTVHEYVAHWAPHPPRIEARATVPPVPRAPEVASARGE